MNTPTAVSRTEPGSASAVKAVSVISTGAVQIHPEQPYGTRKPLYWWLLTSRQWTPPRPINVYVIEHANGLILFDTGQDRASVTDENYFPGGFTGYLYDRLARFDITESAPAPASVSAAQYHPYVASSTTFGRFPARAITRRSAAGLLVMCAVSSFLPSDVIRTSTLRRRCGSIPTTCRPS